MRIRKEKRKTKHRYFVRLPSEIQKKTNDSALHYRAEANQSMTLRRVIFHGGNVNCVFRCFSAGPNQMICSSIRTVYTAPLNIRDETTLSKHASASMESKTGAGLERTHAMMGLKGMCMQFHNCLTIKCARLWSERVPQKSSMKPPPPCLSQDIKHEMPHPYC